MFGSVRLNLSRYIGLTGSFSLIPSTAVINFNRSHTGGGRVFSANLHSLVQASGSAARLRCLAASSPLGLQRGTFPRGAWHALRSAPTRRDGTVECGHIPRGGGERDAEREGAWPRLRKVRARCLGWEVGGGNERFAPRRGLDVVSIAMMSGKLLQVCGGKTSKQVEIKRFH